MKRVGIYLTYSELELLMERFDKNRDGRITLEEVIYLINYLVYE
jgi:Ca2+-binding EF-hand superfamily protein